MTEDCIAIVGMGLRFPPSCDRPDAFWQFLLDGGDAICPVPADRWDTRRFFDEDADRPGKTYVAKGGFLKNDVRTFDPMVFGISPREAQGMDPQQRLLLETAYEAFEDAGIPVEALEGSRTGVFLGGFCLDHLIHIAQPPNRRSAGSHSATSASMTILANRLSYAFNLRGPSFTLDTACSSSLVALHCACNAIRSGECETALAGGSNVMMRPEYPVMMSKGHFLSWHGNCRTFDESAAGYVRGEGAGILVLKSMDRAVADGDDIYAAIRGTGVNQDGRTAGISLPNSEAQEVLMRDLYASAGIPPEEVDYVEAHGTGTQAGDPAEARALNAVFGEGRPADRPLRVGSVKTNIGHLEAAAGVAGVIKAALALKHRTVPKNLHFQTPSPKIPFADYRLQISSESCELPGVNERPELFAGVNSFGYGGTNAHAILSTGPEPVRPKNPDTEGREKRRIYPLAARSPEALRETASRLAFTVRRRKEMSLADFHHTLSRRRSHLGYRGAVLAGDRSELRSALMGASSGEESPDVRLGAEAVFREANPVFVCTGMGPQWWAMGREIFEKEPVCRAALDEVDAAFRGISGWSIREELLGSEAESRMARTEVAQPANFALQVALVRLWESWGVKPATIIGHSVGEVSAAYLSGVYSLEDAVTVSYHRSRLQQQEAGKGTMLAVGLSEEAVRPFLDGIEGVSVAAVNSFASLTLSGDRDGLEKIAGRLEAEEVFQKFLRVEVAYHSPQMNPIREEMRSSLAGLKSRPAEIPLVSTVSGEYSEGTEWDAEYWWKNVREPVRFARGIQNLIGEGHFLFLEIGPHPVLGNSIKEVAAGEGKAAQTVCSLRRKEPECEGLLGSLAELFLAGVNPDWKAMAGGGGTFVRLPGYPWQRKYHWSEAEDSRMYRLGLPGAIYLNQRLAAGLPTWEVEINRQFFPFLPDHGILDQTVFPGMGYVEAALSLGRKDSDGGEVVLSDVDFEKFLIVDPSAIQNLVTIHDPDAGTFEVGSRVEGEAQVQRHAKGRVSVLEASDDVPVFDLDDYRKRCGKPLPLEALYDKLSRRGLRYGSWFRPVAEIRTGKDSFFAELVTEEDLNRSGHTMHPTLLDACLQPILYIARRERLFVPNGMRRMRFFGASGNRFFAYGQLLKQSETSVVGRVWIADTEGRAVAVIEEMTCQAIDSEASTGDLPTAYVPEWIPFEIPQEESGDSGDEPCVVLSGGGTSSRKDLEEKLSNGSDGLFRVDEGADPQAIREWIGERMPGGGRIVFTQGTDPGNSWDYDAIEQSHLAFLQLLRALQSLPGPFDLTILTRTAQGGVSVSDRGNLNGAGLSGLGTLAANECPAVRFRSLDFPAEASGEQVAAGVRSLVESGEMGEFAFRDGEWFARKLKRSSLPPAEIETADAELDDPVRMVLEPGQRIQGIGYRRASRREPGTREVELRVEAASLNYKDYLKVMGRLNQIATRDTYFEDVIGLECVGELTRVGSEVEGLSVGDRVTGFVREAFRSYAVADNLLVVKAPRNSGPEAAGIATAFLTAVHGLEKLAGLLSGERVLIHQASGGVGLAAIAVASARGAEIYATAGSQEKREFLRGMGLERVFDSRSGRFAEEIRKETRGEGVDVVIGAVSGVIQHESLDLLRSGGRYIDLGKKDIVENAGLPLRAFNRNLLYAAVDIDRLILERPKTIRSMLGEVVERIESGNLDLSEGTLFPAAEIRDAFQFMAQSGHRGKILLNFGEGRVKVPARERLPGRIRADGSYLVTGGTSGFGLETAKWLLREGAGRVVLLSRRGRRVEGLEDMLSLLEDEPGEIVVEAGNVTDPDTLGRVARTLSKDGMQPAGLIHAAMVLDDAMLPDQTGERFRKVFLPKVKGLLLLLEHLPVKAMDFLVFYSSISSLIGNRGQANYVAANAVLDVAAHFLRGRGLPALSLNFGALAETGVVARSGDLGGILGSAGVRGLSNQEALTFLRRSLAADLPQVAAVAVDWERWSESHPALSGDRRFAEHLEGASHGEDDPVLAELRSELEDEEVDVRLAIIEKRLAGGLSAVLKVSETDLKPETRLSEMGVDSLLLLELSLELRSRVGVTISAMEFLKGPSLRELSGIVLDRAGLESGSPS